MITILTANLQLSDAQQLPPGDDPTDSSDGSVFRAELTSALGSDKNPGIHTFNVVFPDMPGHAPDAYGLDRDTKSVLPLDAEIELHVAMHPGVGSGNNLPLAATPVRSLPDFGVQQERAVYDQDSVAGSGETLADSQANISTEISVEELESALSVITGPEDSGTSITGINTVDHEHTHSKEADTQRPELHLTDHHQGKEASVPVPGSEDDLPTLVRTESTAPVLGAAVENRVPNTHGDLFVTDEASNRVRFANQGDVKKPAIKGIGQKAGEQSVPESRFAHDTVSKSVATTPVGSEQRLPPPGNIQQFLTALRSPAGEPKSDGRGLLAPESRSLLISSAAPQPPVSPVADSHSGALTQLQSHSQPSPQPSLQPQTLLTAAQQSGSMNATGLDPLVQGDRVLGSAEARMQWGERINRRVALMVARGSQVAHIQLDPPELGKLMIRVQVAGDQASIHFASPHAVVRDALESGGTRLQEMLSEQGLSLSDMDVSDHTSGEREESEQDADASTMAGVDEESAEQPLVIDHTGLVDAYV